MHRLLGALGLLACDGAEGHEDGKVDGSSIIKDAANDPLDLFYFLLGEWGGRVRFVWTLGFTTILFWLGEIRTMLGFCGGDVLVKLKLLEDKAGHQYVEGLCDVIPGELYAAVKIAVPILAQFFVFSLYCRDQMLNIFFSFIFDSEIIDNEGERNGTGSMFPKPRSVLALVIAVGGKAFPNKLVG